MADYSSRLEELDRQIEEAQQKALDAEKSGGPAVAPDAFVRVKAVVATYGDWRDRAFNDGIPILKAESDGTARRYQQRWLDHYIKAATDAFRTSLSFSRARTR